MNIWILNRASAPWPFLSTLRVCWLVSSGQLQEKTRGGLGEGGGV